ncbi:hypothetical protein ONZ51_g8647 [Trametes cubensis]|uniref:Uncharacterized protein n=1 Tax=Trametes cubensis TaxID=1111947 RepID=A0AAD7XAN8_9APHY|nr:hypothetical protein ONZ51_g8647 [Trametes cubensis]
MHFSAILVAATLAAPATATILGMTCYDATECPTCESRESLSDAADEFCSGTKWEGNEYLPWGNAQITLEGTLSSQQICLQGISDIVNQCYGVKDGGIITYPFNNARLDVNFCNCE